MKPLKFTPRERVLRYCRNGQVVFVHRSGVPLAQANSVASSDPVEFNYTKPPFLSSRVIINLVPDSPPITCRMARTPSTSAIPQLSRTLRTRVLDNVRTFGQLLSSHQYYTFCSLSRSIYSLSTYSSAEVFLLLRTFSGAR